METPAAGADTSTQTTTTAPSTAGTEATAPGAGTQPPAWSLDTWKDEEWDALPERIRTAADKRYEGIYTPRLTEAQNALATHQRDLAAARQAVREANAARLAGDPYGAKELTDAQAVLAKAQADFEAYKKDWSPERFDAHKADLQRQWAEAQQKGNEAWNTALDAEVQRNARFLYPWFGEKNGDAPNPNYDADKTNLALTLAKHPMFRDDDLPDAWFLAAAELNKAQVHNLITAIGGGQDPMAALEAARRPPKHEPTPAARAAGGGGQRPAPRPDEGVPRRSSSSTRGRWDAAVERTESRIPNPR